MGWHHMWPLSECCDVSFVAVLSAVGGLSVHAQTGSVQAAYMGFGASAVLGMSAVAMSDIRDSELGELGVKAAWGERLCGGCVVHISSDDIAVRQLMSLAACH
jgi:hypothetical protein